MITLYFYTSDEYDTKVEFMQAEEIRYSGTWLILDPMDPFSRTYECQSIVRLSHKEYIVNAPMVYQCDTMRGYSTYLKKIREEEQ
jgi:hypothetical protein